MHLPHKRQSLLVEMDFQKVAAHELLWHGESSKGSAVVTPDTNKCGSQHTR